MRVTAEARKEAGHLLVHHRVIGDGSADRLELLVGRQLAVEQEIADSEEVRVLRQLVDRVAAVEKFAYVAVDVGDARGAVRGRGEAWIVSKAARVAIDLGDVDDVGARGAAAHIQFDGFSAQSELGRARFARLGRGSVDVRFDAHRLSFLTGWRRILAALQYTLFWLPENGQALGTHCPTTKQSAHLIA